MPPAWVYVLRCRDGSLYTGWSSDAARRLARHRAGTASRYTASRLPVELALAIPLTDRRTAMRAEARIKALSRPQKLALIAQLARENAQIFEETLMSIGRLADTYGMQTNHPAHDGAGRAAEGVEPVAMEREEMRRALERISHEMLQRVADSFELGAPPAAARQ